MEINNLRKVKSDNWLVEDIQKFEQHYSKNKDRWDKALDWLKNTDLESINPGKYFIDDEKVFAIVTDYIPKDKSETRFEAHKKYIDVQYVVRGKELIGVTPLSKAKPLTQFDDQKDTGFFTVSEDECKYYETGKGRFFIFFPEDAHRPGIKIAEREEVRKVVVKILKH